MTAINKSLMITLCYVFPLIGLITGCTFHRTSGHDINMNAVSQIFTGKTTKYEVASYLGQPLQTRGEINGSETWYYAYAIQDKTIIPSPSTRVDLNRIERTEKSVRVMFGKNGIAKECIYSTYTNVGTPFKSETDISIGRGNTTRTRCQDVR